MRGLVSLAVLVAVFGFGLPRLADYEQAWVAIMSMSGGAIGVIALVAAWNLYSYWPVLRAALPGLSTREAIVVNQASTAVANSVPGGGTLAVAVTYRMLRAWGFTTQSIANQVVATGTANALVKLSMPAGALALVAVTGEIRGAFYQLTVAGLVATVPIVVAAMVILRSPRATERAGRSIDQLVVRVRSRVRPHRRDQPAPAVGAWLERLRADLVLLARRSGIRLISVTLISHVSLYVVLLMTLRGVGVGAEDVSWTLVFAVFAFVRLLSALPITPGGAGVVELGYVGFLTNEAPAGMSAQVTAGVLVFRAITFALPLLFGSIAWIVFQTATSWRRPPDTRGQVPDA
jgi:putative heme transporter